MVKVTKIFKIQDNYLLEGRASNTAVYHLEDSISMVKILIWTSDSTPFIRFNTTRFSLEDESHPKSKEVKSHRGQGHYLKASKISNPVIAMAQIKRLMKSQMLLAHVYTRHILLFFGSLVINLLDWVQIQIKIISQRMPLMST